MGLTASIRSRPLTFLFGLAAISLLAACAAPIQEVHDAEKSVNDQLQSAQQWMAATTVRDDAVE